MRWLTVHRSRPRRISARGMHLQTVPRVGRGRRRRRRDSAGQQFGFGEPAHQMARVVSDTIDEQTGGGPSIGMATDRLARTRKPGCEFRRSLGQPFSGFNDWANIRLDQISANGLGGGSEDFMLFSSVAADDWSIWRRRPGHLGRRRLDQSGRRRPGQFWRRRLARVGWRRPARLGRRR